MSELDFDADTQFAVQGYWLKPNMPYRLRLKRRIGCTTRWQECDVTVLAVALMMGSRRQGGKQYMVELEDEILWPDGTRSDCCRISEDGFWADPNWSGPESGSVAGYLMLPLEVPDDGTLFQFEHVLHE